jgi:hypothetical protein
MAGKAVDVSRRKIQRTTMIENDNTSSCPAERNRCAEASGASADDGDIEVVAACFLHSKRHWILRFNGLVTNLSRRVTSIFTRPTINSGKMTRAAIYAFTPARICMNGF